MTWQPWNSCCTTTSQMFRHHLTTQTNNIKSYKTCSTKVWRIKSKVASYCWNARRSTTSSSLCLLRAGISYTPWCHKRSSRSTTKVCRSWVGARRRSSNLRRLLTSISNSSRISSTHRRSCTLCTTTSWSCMIWTSWWNNSNSKMNTRCRQARWTRYTRSWTSWSSDLRINAKTGNCCSSKYWKRPFLNCMPSLKCTMRCWGSKTS